MSTVTPVLTPALTLERLLRHHCLVNIGAPDHPKLICNECSIERDGFTAREHEREHGHWHAPDCALVVVARYFGFVDMSQSQSDG